LALCVCVLCVGCGETPAPLESSAASSELTMPESLRLPAELAITEKPLTEPMTNDEILAFIDLVKSLPDGQPPAFSLMSSAAKVQGLQLDAAVQAWRAAVRNSLTTDTLMKGWNPRTALRRAIDESHVPPRALTSLMLRLSCSMGVEAMGGRRNVAAQRVIADENINRIVANIQRLDRAGQLITNSAWEGLEEATSLAEYLAILTTMPVENQLVLAEHQDALAAILKMPSQLKQPTESHGDNHIVPVRYEEPVPRKSQKSRAQRTR
jgi:hypothetical protein